MAVLKFILIFLVISLIVGAWFVKFALQKGMHVPTNQELIFATKAYVNRDRSKKPTEKKTVMPKKLNR